MVVAGLLQSAASLQSSCSHARPHARLPVTGQDVHAARSSLSKRTAVGIAAAAPRTSCSALGSSGGATAAVFEEEVDAIAVLEQGAVPSSHFEQHDHALLQLRELVAVNAELYEAISDADIVLEQASWEGNTLPPQTKQKFLHTYREDRKEQRRARKEQRQQQREERERARMTHGQHTVESQPAPAVEQPPAAQPQQQQQSSVQGIPAAASSSSSQSTAAPPRQRQRAVAPQQPLAQPALQQQQPSQQRTRRSRSSASTAPAAISSSVLSCIVASIPTPSTSTVSSSTSTVSSSTPAAAAAAGPAPRRSAAAAKAASPAAAAAPVAPSAGQSAAAKPRRSAATRATVASPAASSITTSSSSSALAVAAPVQPQRTPSFAPLPVLQQQQQQGLAAPVRAAASRRLQRGSGVSRRSVTAGSTATSAVATPVAAAPTAAAKLADNTMHGLDMRAELLTAEQERELAVMIQDLLGLEEVARQLAVQLGRTPTELEWIEAAGGQGDMTDQQAALTSFMARLTAGRSAKQVMIKANYKLVVSICRKYQGHGMNMGDLINEGIAGLVKGVERFEPAKGFKFSTYAHWWIRQSVSRSLADQGRLVRLPIHMQELLSKASKASKAFEAKHGREPTAEELAPELGVEAGRIRDAWEAVTSPRSLDQPMGDAEGGTLGDVVEDDRTIGSEEAVFIESLKKDLEGVLTGLDDRDAGVLRMRFGLLDGREYTLDEVGAEFKVTRERIRQIEAKAIRQLRAHHISPGSVMADYQLGPMSDKALASRTSSGTKKQK